MSEARWSWHGWRIAAIGLAVLLLALAAVWITLVRLYPPQRLAALLAAEVQAATGRELRIGGELSIRLLPSIAVVAGDVTLGNAAWGSQPAMARLQRAAFEVALKPLLDGRIDILQVQVQGVQLLLESDGQGRVNWQFTPPVPAPAPSGGGAASAVRLDRLLATDTRISWRDGGSGLTRSVAIAALELQAQGDHDRLAATLDLGGVAWQVQARVGRLLDLARGGTDWPFTLHASATGAELAAEGRAGTGTGAGQDRATIRLQVDSAAPLVSLAPALARLPLPLALQARVERDRETVRIEALQLSLAGQAIGGQLAWRSDGPRPSLTGTLSAAALDLARLQAAAASAAGNAGTPGTAQRDEPLFGDEWLPFADLASLPVMVLALRIDRLALPGMPQLAGVSGRLDTAPGRLQVDRLTAAVLGGQVSGQLVVQLPTPGKTARGAAAPTTSLRIDARGLSVDALTALSGAGMPLQGGRADLVASLRLTGDSPRSLAASANGELLLQLAGATLSGAPAMRDRSPLAQLLDALLPHRSDGGEIAIACAVLRLPLTQGVARIDRSIALESDQLAISASGQIDLRAQTVALAFHPQVKKGLGLNPANLAQLVTLQGPLQAPAVAIDPKGTAREAVTVGAAVATGGLTLLAGRLLEAPAASQTCQTAVGGTEAPQRSAVPAAKRR